MKKILAAICIFAALMGTLGCGGSQTAGNKPAEKKELIVGTEPSFAPFEFPDKKSGEITGFDMELIKAMGKKAGFAKVTVKGMGFDALIPALDAGNIDVAIAGMSITDARKQKVNFTDPYYESGLATLVRKDNTTIKSLNDLKGKTIAVQLGTTGAEAAGKIEGATVKDLRYFRYRLPGTEERGRGCGDQRSAGAPVFPEAGRRGIRQDGGRTHQRGYVRHCHRQEEQGPGRQAEQSPGRPEKKRGIPEDL